MVLEGTSIAGLGSLSETTDEEEAAPGWMCKQKRDSGRKNGACKVPGVGKLAWEG